MIDIRRDNTRRREHWFAVTDKGLIWGGSKEIVERKLLRVGAKEPTYGEDKRKVKTEAGKGDLREEAATCNQAKHTV